MSEKESQHESEIEDSSDQSINTSQIKQKISLTNQQLRQLSNDDGKFFQTIIQTNDKAVQRILATSSKQALVYLGQAERILEYGACCGKVIDRNLIVCVLHNEAAAYQRIWALDKCSKYIEAVIYNLELSLGSESASLNENIFQQANFKSKEYEILCSVMKRKLYLVQYHLQYCAIISQLKNHELALGSSTKSLYLIKEIIQTCYKYYKKNVYKQKQEMQIAGRKLKLLKQLSQYKEQIDLSCYQHLLKRVKYVYKEWRAHKDIQKEDQMHQWIKSYSIGNVMQMEPSTYKDFDNLKEFTAQFHIQTLTKKILLFAISYFTIATEIRLIEAQKHPNEQQKRNSIEFRKSEIYHLTAIKIFCTYVPYQSMFIKHVLHSYTNHYKPELKDEEATFITDDQLTQKQKLESNTKKSMEEKQKQKQKQVITNSNFHEDYEEQIKEDFYDKVNVDQKQQNSNQNQIDEDNQIHIKPLNPDVVQKKKNKKQKIQVKVPVIHIRPHTGKTPSSQKNKMVSPKGNTSRVLTAKLNTNKQNPINRKSKQKINSNSKQKIKQTTMKSPRAPLKSDFKKQLKQKPKQKKKEKESTNHNNSNQIHQKSQNKKTHKVQKKETQLTLKNQCEYFPKKSKSKPKPKKK